MIILHFYDTVTELAAFRVATFCGPKLKLFAQKMKIKPINAVRAKLSAYKYGNCGYLSTENLFTEK